MRLLLNKKNTGRTFCRRMILALCLVAAALGASACAQRTRLFTLPNQEVAPLTAYDICHIMQRAGFDDARILEEGPALRNALAHQGAAQIRVGSSTEAIFAVHLPYVHISSRQRGMFVYNIEKSQFMSE